MNRAKNRTRYVFMAMSIFLFVAVPAWAESPFESAEIRVTWEYWNGGSPGQGGSLIVATDTLDVVGDDAVDPDVVGFHTSPWWTAPPVSSCEGEMSATANHWAQSFSRAPGSEPSVM